MDMNVLNSGTLEDRPTLFNLWTPLTKKASRPWTSIWSFKKLLLTPPYLQEVLRSMLNYQIILSLGELLPGE